MEKNSYTSALIHGTQTESIPSTGSITFSNKRSYVPPTSECIEAEGMVVLAGSSPSSGTGQNAKESTFEYMESDDDLTPDSYTK